MAIGYDLIGDVHGHAAKLRLLLCALGYVELQGAYRHPEGRTAIFLGDLIDRGPSQLEVLAIVRAMWLAGTALAVLGNHELNAIGYATPSERHPGRFLRPHTSKNAHQHAAFLEQIGEGSAAHKDAIEWFMQLPIFLELDGLRVVHAWWHEAHVGLIRSALPRGRLADCSRFVQDAFTDGHPAFEAIEGLTKGLEADLPAGISYLDAGGVSRRRSRVKWWAKGRCTYAEGLMVSGLSHVPSMGQLMPDSLPLGVQGDTPLFIGHYWLSGAPTLLSTRVACLDYSVARGGPLVAYRWDGEAELCPTRFVSTSGD